MSQWPVGVLPYRTLEATHCAGVTMGKSCCFARNTQLKFVKPLEQRNPFNHTSLGPSGSFLLGSGTEADLGQPVLNAVIWSVASLQIDLPL